MPYKSILTFFLFLLFSLSVLAQKGTFNTNLVHSKESNLDEFLLDYHIHKIPVNNIQNHLFAEDYNNNLSLSFESQFKVDIYLFENNLIDYNYKVRTTNGEQASNTKAFEGNVKSTGENVRLTINEDFIYGIIKYENEEYYIEPLRYFNKNADRDLFVIYSSRDVIKDNKTRCAVNDKVKVAYEQNVQESSTHNRRFVDNCYIVEMAIASDYDMYTSYNSSVADVENHNIGVMNNVQLDFRSEFDDNVEFKIVEQYVATATPDPWTTSTQVDPLINDFKAWGNTAGNFTVGFDVGQFWTTRDLADGTNTDVIGYANIGVICTTNKYQILEDYSSTAWQLRVLTTHELGHNFDALHDASGTSYIMAPSVNNTSDWSFTSALDISNHIDTRTCLHNCDAEGAPVAAFTSGGTAACVGSTVEFKDISQYGATRTWTFPGGSPASSTDAKESVTYNTAGTYDVTLTSTNAAGSSTITQVGHVIIIDPTTSSCLPSGAAGAGGISFFGLSNLSSSTSTNQIYQDLTCNEAPIGLEVNTNYNITIGLGDCSVTPTLFERAKFYIDYDNDGSFSAAEEVAATNSLWCGTVSNNNDAGLTFTSSTSPVLDTLLRMRVIVDNTNITSACYTPTTGEVEDYSVIFKSVPVGCAVVNTVTDNPAVGLYEASEKILTSGTVEVTTDASFEAGDTICLENDFEVLASATFSAEIVTPCTSFAPSEPNSSRVQIQHAAMNQNANSYDDSLIFDLPLKSKIQVFVHNKEGALVCIPEHDRNYNAGAHKISLVKTDLKPGLYYVSLRTEFSTYTKPWIVSKLNKQTN